MKLQDTHIYLTIALILLIPAGLTGQIPPGETRIETLEKAREMLNNDGAELATILEEASDPFVREATQQAAPVITETGEELPPAAQRLPDNLALEAIAKKFNPTGTMTLGERQVLLLPSGSSMQIGGKFRAKISDFTYTVELIEISSDGYTLALNDAQLSRKFADNNSGGQASFDQNTSSE